jgi:DNA-binding protein
LFDEKKNDTIIIRAMGKAINKTITITEIIKRRVKGLHQVTDVSSNKIVDHWEPIDGNKLLIF